MDLGNNFLSKIESNADKIAAIAGFLFYDQNGVLNVLDSINNALAGNIHLPDLKAAFESFQRTGKLGTVLTTFIAGYAIDELDLPMIGRFGKPLQKAAIGYGLGSAALLLLTSSTHSPAIGASLGNSGSGGNPFDRSLT